MRYVVTTLTALCALMGQSSAVLSNPQHSTSEQQVRRLAQGSQNNHQWHAAAYRGLVVGKSTRANMLRVLGRPKRIDIPEGQEQTDPYQEVWYVYARGGEFPGEFTITIDKHSGVITEMFLHPKKLLKKAATAHYGTNYLATRYDFCDEPSEEEARPIYESSNGSLLYIEYRNRGIALVIDQTGLVTQVLYVNKPIGLKSRADCKRMNTQ